MCSGSKGWVFFCFLNRYCNLCRVMICRTIGGLLEILCNAFFQLEEWNLGSFLVFQIHLFCFPYCLPSEYCPSAFCWVQHAVKSALGTVIQYLYCPELRRNEGSRTSCLFTQPVVGLCTMIPWVSIPALVWTNWTQIHFSQPSFLTQEQQDHLAKELYIKHGIKFLVQYNLSGNKGIFRKLNIMFWTLVNIR